MAQEQPKIDSVVAALARDSGLVSFEELPKLVNTQAERAGMFGLRIFLSDRRQRMLKELTGEGPDAGKGGERLRVDGTVAGLAFIHNRIVQVGRKQRYWIPILDGSERLGVLYVHHVEFPDEQALTSLASIIGLLMVDKRPSSDAYARLIRTRPMSVSAEMQWTLMPPNTFINKKLTVSAVTEPVYDNAGDSFDYALTGEIAHLALFDAMGHDNIAGMLAHLTVGAFRNQRRLGIPLADLPARVEETLVEELEHSRFTTGIMAELNTTTGWFSWVNCGHLPPILLRGGSQVLTMECEPSHPLGLNFDIPVTVCHQQLEPGDRVLMYTDGMIETRDPQGQEFGINRFTDFIVRHEADKLPVPETLRRLIQAILAYHGDKLEDDATVLYCEWHGQ